MIGVLLIALGAQQLMAQAIKRIGDLPKSDYTIMIFQVAGYQEGPEGYKLTYVDSNNEPKWLYLPIELRDKFKVYSPQQNMRNLHFVIIWKQGEAIDKIEWYKPQVIDYSLPTNLVQPFNDRDKQIFKAIVNKGEIMIGDEIFAISPEIKAPGGM